MANVSASEIVKNMSDPPDQKRKKTMDKLAKKAAAGDQSALLRLEALSGYDAAKEGGLGGTDPYAGLRDQFKVQYGTTNPGAATADAQNYARLLVSNLTGQPAPNFLPPKDAYIGDSIGKVLKVVAPVAGALIPGVGLLGAAAIGGLGNAAGQYAEKGSVNVGQAALSGGLAAGGNALLGNGLGAGGTGALGSTPASVAATGPAGTGWGGNAVAGVNGTAPAAQAATGIGGALKGAAKYAPLVLGGLQAINQASQQSRANDLQNQALQFARQDYNGRAPYREQLMARLSAPDPTAPDLSGLFQSSNPYGRRYGAAQG